MIGIDTNVLIRFLVKDELKEFQLVDQLFIKARSSRQTLHISVVVLCEVVWVLESCYNVSKNRILEVMQFLLQVDLMEIDCREQVMNTMELYREYSADFADCLLGELHRSNGCDHTVTFDKKASQLPSFKRLVQKPVAAQKA